MKEKFIWSMDKRKKIKIREIREHNIVWNKEHNTFDVTVFGFFGGGVVIYTNTNEMECRKFIDELTGERG